jgi:hypothetical protein
VCSNVDLDVGLFIHIDSLIASLIFT